MVRQKKQKFRTKRKAIIKPIDPLLVKVVKKLQQDLQRKENIEFGKKAQTVTFQFASMTLGGNLLK